MSDMDKQRAYDECKGMADIGEAQQPMVDRGTVGVAATGCGPYQIPLREQLENSFRRNQDRDRRMERAHSILSRHPEFEEFLELQDLINRDLFR